jgi:YegS/Rv2252/BmrU family lipid kinase
MSNKAEIVRFIINPISGIGKQKMLEKLIPKIKHKRFQAEIVYTQYPGHARELAAQAVAQGISTICVAGGDGSVHEAASSIMKSNSQLAIIPTGSGNGIARHYGIPLQPEKALDLLVGGKTQATDVGHINQFPFFGFAGVGFDAHIAHEFAKIGKRGFKGYFQAVSREFWKYKPATISLNHEKGKEDVAPFVLTFTNVSQYGNGFRIDAQANPCDGLLAACMIDQVNWMNFPIMALQARRGKLSKNVRFRRIEGAHFEIPLLENPRIHVDGEPVTLDSKSVKISISAGALQILVPKGFCG